ncbi:MAG: nuclear transport factor 2 family protein [Promethearchaeota archaeon]
MVSLNKTSLVEFCNRWLAAWSGNQPQNLLTFYHEEILYRDPGCPQGLQGKIALEGYLEKMLTHNPDWTWKLVELFPTSIGFNFKWKANIPLRHEKPPNTDSVEEIVEFGMDIVEIRDGQIVRNEVYFDRTKWISRLKKL